MTSGQNRFQNLDFEGFKKLAQDPTLSQYEKIGFPDSYRAGFERQIFEDICSKLTNLEKSQQTLLDIGPGCSELPLFIIELCRRMGHRLILIDSPEMLGQLPDEPFVVKIPGLYPRDCPELFQEYAHRVDAILTYSVLHYVFVETSLFTFLDKSLELMADGGQMLIGDVPNVSKRKRFFSSPDGIAFHRQFTGREDNPEVHFNTIETNNIDDSAILAVIMRSRLAGFDAYWLPQRRDLPMANRREDILIMKP